ncbi:uncharacterized protein LOC121426824 isoform X1 [Lytechinus variegatus]|uniref:uncharacterized protein LOC121426824 isoform X1 n=1 Tax=Lytechinus variegatus TaxID=7654 RepID=UPI001BB0DE8C|nr:uncharacterized protein LOC121426824 isoform X1 [Lytechinus variegatus]
MEAEELMSKVFGEGELQKLAGKKCGLPEIQKFQNYLGEQDYQIVVYANMSNKGVVYRGPDKKHMLVLFLHNNHFDVVTSLPAFLQRSYFCSTCFKGFDAKDKHVCINSCTCCKQQSACALEEWIHCKFCRRNFKNPGCFENHLKKGKADASICQKVKRCECGQIVDARRTNPSEHKCYQVYCERCRSNVDKEDHLCYMQPLPTPEEKEKKEKEKKEKNKKGKQSKKGGKSKGKNDETEKNEKEEKKQMFIFYDFECQQDEKVGQNQHGSIFKHIPNLCVAFRVCEDCYKEKKELCKHCKTREHVFKGEDTLDDFCQWLLGSGREHKGAIAIAHNNRSYDSQFIQEYCHKNAIVPDIIVNGTKIISMTVNDVKLIDSLSFLAMPLSSFPSTFGFEELKKGFFPHFFNTRDNQNYKGPMPPKGKYDPDGMTEGKRAEFNAWYEKHKNDHFDFEKEILEYCQSDCQILMEGCMSFRKLFMAITKNIDPFGSITIAAACNVVFRTHFLEVDTIGLIPQHGYKSKERHSLAALKWLKWVSHKEGIRLQHARNGGEFKIGRYRVDGYHVDSKTVYEFLGDLWHGCPKCYKRRDILVPGTSETLQDVYESTLTRIEELRKMGYTVITMWECDFRKMSMTDSNLAKFLKNLDIQEPMNPRHAFYGGRTNAIKLRHRIEGTEKIKYVDVCSLYPWVCKYARYPIGHPEIITENFDDLDSYFGIIKCEVSPPRGLFHPVLPHRSTEGKLIFPLCRTCADTKQTTPCHHTERERALHGTWVTEEVKKAVQLGYRLNKIQEVWHYPQTSEYSPEIQMGGLFSEYINLFLKVKQESSGWPAECRSNNEEVSTALQEKRADYINQYHKKEGVLLDPLQIKANKGLRAVSKICLNSFWGKFGQRNNFCKTKYFTKPEEFYSLVTDPTLTIKSVAFPSDVMAQVQYQSKDDFLEVLPNTNVVVAAFTTCHARLKLYSYIENLGENVLYFDTDSIIYLKDAKVRDIPTGNFLGDMTDELEKDFGMGSYITELLALGPKNYSYKVFSTSKQKEMVGTCKVRGITLNYRNSQLINFESCAELLHGKRSQTIVTNPHRIAKTRDHNIVSRVETKSHHLVYDKRVRINDFDTIPYGY